MNNIIIYNTEDGKAKINLILDDGSVWLSQSEIAELFQTTKQNISKHIKSIFQDLELSEEETVNYKLTVQNEGTRTVERKLAYYNLDMILAIGYRVRSPRGIQFRKYASTVLKDYLIKGFAIDDERLKELGGGSYFKELLDRIRDIRSSEKVFYRQVLDLFSTAVDYNPISVEAKSFFATVQNKMHFAVHHNTASEVIYKRVDSKKEFMGLTTFKGELPTLKEAQIAKNYLTEKELQGLNQLVSGYLDFAERQAQREVPMTMADWIKHIDAILSATGEAVLQDKGHISHQQMQAKVLSEYQKYQNLIIDNIYQIPSNIDLEQTLMNNFSAKIDHFLAESGQSINPAVLNATTHYIVQVYLGQLTMHDTIHEIKQNFAITKKYMDILTLIILISLLALIVLNYFLYDLMGWRIFIFTTTLILFLAGYLAAMPICQQMIQQIFVIK